MCRGGFAGRGRRYADRIRVTWHTRSAATRSMTVCPCSPSVLAPTSSASAVGPRETLQSAVGATVGTRSFFVSSAQAVRAVGQPPPVSEAWSRAPATNPRRFAHRITDMAPMLRHADPCRASPCRPCRLLSASGRARPRSRALSSPGAKAAEAAPIPGMLSFESSSSFVIAVVLLSISAIFSFKPCFSGVQGRRCQQRKLPDVGSVLRNCNAELRDREAPSGSAAARTSCAPATPAVPRSSRRRTSGGTRLRRSPRRSRLTKGLTQTGGNNLTSWPSFSRPR